jgi:RNA polymerase subunit RPABC4/transcription elongation factor Spt4
MGVIGMSPTEKIGEELRRIFLNKDTPTRPRTSAERTRDSVGAYAVGCLAASIFFSMMNLFGVHNLDKLPLIGWAVSLMDKFAFPAYWVLLPYYVYLDAKIRGMNAAPWGLLCLATNFIGLFTYLVVRNPDPIPCSGCGRLLDPGVRACPYCGAMTERACPSCGAPIGQDWQFCPACAAVIPKHVATVQTVGPQAPTSAPVDPEQRARDIPRIIEQARAAARSAEDADTQVAQAVERIASGEVFTRRARIGGCVFDAATGQPIAGATIRSDASGAPLNATTDEQGVYSLVDLEPGPYVLIAETEGYHRAARSCNPPAGQSAILDFRLVRELEPAASTQD